MPQARGSPKALVFNLFQRMSAKPQSVVMITGAIGDMSAHICPSFSGMTREGHKKEGYSSQQKLTI
jgi:hypothetical protein